MNKFTCKKYLRGWETHTCLVTPQSHNRGLSDWKLKLSPTWLTQYWSHLLPPDRTSQVYTNRKLDSWVELGLKPRYFHIEHGCLNQLASTCPKCTFLRKAFVITPTYMLSVSILFLSQWKFTDLLLCRWEWWGFFYGWVPWRRGFCSPSRLTPHPEWLGSEGPQVPNLPGAAQSQSTHIPCKTQLRHSETCIAELHFSLSWPSS